MNSTIEALIHDISRSDRLKEKLLENLNSKKRKTITLNLTEIDFDFKKKEVEIFYFVIDDKFPNEKIMFKEFAKLIESNINPNCP